MVRVCVCVTVAYQGANPYPGVATEQLCQLCVCVCVTVAYQGANPYPGVAAEQLCQLCVCV